MKKWLWLGLLILWVPSAWAVDVAPDDFAYGIRIDVPPGTAIAAMSLPAIVYQSSCRRDLTDIRVFNADGEPVPHLIRYARTRAGEAIWQSLAFFPLPGESEAKRGGYRVHVHTDADGAVVSVDPQTASTAPQPAHTYLIDVSRLRRRPDWLRLEWQPNNANRLATFAVDASSDLINWTTLQPRAVIGDVHYGGHRLLSNTVSLKAGGKRYLRLRRLDPGPPISLTRIMGRLAPEGRHAMRVYLKVDGHKVPEASGVYQYEIRGVFPVDRVNLIFSQPNSVADATLESRDGSTAAWTRRFKGLFYRIDADRLPLTSSPQPVPISTDRRWRLTVNASDSTIGSHVPRLEIGYRPHDLFFFARGKGPFTLAFGSAGIKPLKVNVSALFDGIGDQAGNDLERWVRPASGRIVLGGPRRLSPLPKPLPVRQLVLWSVLLAGVLVVALMAWHLARRLKSV